MPSSRSSASCQPRWVGGRAAAASAGARLRQSVGRGRRPFAVQSLSLQAWHPYWCKALCRVFGRRLVALPERERETLQPLVRLEGASG